MIYNRTYNLKTLGSAITPPRERTAKVQWRHFDMNILSSKVSGIYKIENTINGNCYIGSAVNIHSRWIDHRKRLRRGNHHCRHLQFAWNKYGESAFSFVVLQVVKRKEDLISNEQKFIDRLNPKYNTARIAGSTLGVACLEKTKIAVSKASHERIITDEYRRNMSAVKRGVRFTKQHSKNISLGRILFFLNGGKAGTEKPIKQFSRDGKFIAQYESIAEASRKTGLKATHISRAAKGRRKATGGFVWRYAEKDKQ